MVQKRSGRPFDPYRTWLQLKVKKGRRPTFYELIGVAPTERDRDVIAAAAAKQILFVKSQLGTGHDAEANALLTQLQEAELTLLDDDLKRRYDARLKARGKRRKRTTGASSATMASVAPGEAIDALPPRVGGSQPVGEGADFLRSFAGIVAILAIACGGLVWLSFQLPWAKLADPDFGRDLVAGDLAAEENGGDEQNAGEGLPVAAKDRAAHRDGTPEVAANDKPATAAATSKADSPNESSPTREDVPLRLPTDGSAKSPYESDSRWLPIFRTLEGLARRQSNHWGLHGDGFTLTHSAISAQNSLVPWVNPAVRTNFEVRLRFRQRAGHLVLQLRDAATESWEFFHDVHLAVEDGRYPGQISANKGTGSRVVDADDQVRLAIRRSVAAREWSELHVVAGASGIRTYLNGHLAGTADASRRQCCLKLGMAQFWNTGPIDVDVKDVFVRDLPDQLTTGRLEPIAVESGTPPTAAIAFKSGWIEIPRLRLDGNRPFTIEALVASDAGSGQLSGHLLSGGARFGFASRDVSWVFRVNGRSQKATAHLPLTTAHRRRLLHIAGVHYGSAVRVFVDGEMSERESKGAGAPSSDVPVLVGADPRSPAADGTPRPPQSHFTGRLVALRIVEEVLYRAPFEPPTQLSRQPSTAVLYDAAKTAGCLLLDQSGNDRHGRLTGSLRIERR